MISIIKFGIFIKRLVTAFFVSVVYKFLRIILKFIFYNFLVKIYRFYIYIYRKFNRNRINGRLSFVRTFLTSQKFIHFCVVGLTIIIIFGTTSSSRAESIVSEVEKTILSDLVKGDFSSQEEDELIEEFLDEETITNIQNQSYLDDLSFLESHPSLDFSEFEIEEGAAVVQGGTTLKKPGMAATTKTKQPRTEIVEYVVESGDTVSTIALEFDVSVNTILWENNLSAYSLIRPGDKLSILPMSGVTHKVVSGESIKSIASKYKADEEKIISINKLADASKLTIGQKLIVPGGSKVTYTSYSKTSYSAIDAIKDLVKPNDARPAASNKMNWPTVGHRITQYYSWRHHGLDIANKTGTAIYAADAGTIESAGWGTGYGYNIVINHGGGKKTRYAHLSKFYVKKGQKVSKGETIAAMGSTGWSTGPHLHFEVIIGSVKYNPLNYIR